MTVKEIKDVRVLEEGTGLQIVLLHAAGQPPEGFTRQINLLSPYVLVIAPNIFDLARKVSSMNFDELAINLKKILDYYPNNKKKLEFIYSMYRRAREMGLLGQ